MKKNLKILLLCVFVAVASCSFTTKEFNDPDKDKLLIDLITYVLDKGHYDPKDMDNVFSAGVYKDFINSMDPLKRYFLASDIEDFRVYETDIDDQIRNKDLTFFNLVYERFLERQAASKNYYTDILSKPFDYSKDETINVDYDKIPYGTSKKELKERWRRQLKFSAISNYYDLVDEKKTSEENKKDAFNNNEEFVESENAKLTLTEMEDKARTMSKTSLDDYYEFVDDLERKDYFAQFLNVVVEEFDPHTNYFAPPDRDRFDLRMSGKLEGIGARLQKKMTTSK